MTNVKGITPSFSIVSFLIPNSLILISLGRNLWLLSSFLKLWISRFYDSELPYYPKLVRVFYNNLEICYGFIFSKVHKIPIVVDQSLFYSLTKLSSQGVPFEGILVDDWKSIYSSHDAQKMVYVEHLIWLVIYLLVLLPLNIVSCIILCVKYCFLVPQILPSLWGRYDSVIGPTNWSSNWLGPSCSLPYA